MAWRRLGALTLGVVATPATAAAAVAKAVVTSSTTTLPQVRSRVGVSRLVSTAGILGLVAIFVLLAHAQTLDVRCFGDRFVSFPADRALWTVGGVVLSAVDAPGIAKVTLVRVRQLDAAEPAAMRAGSKTDVRPVPDGEAGGAELRLGVMRHAAALGLAVQHRAGNVGAQESDDGGFRVPHHPRAEDGHAKFGAELSLEFFGRGARADVVDDALAGVLRGQNVRAHPAGSSSESDEVDLVDFRRGGCSGGFDDANVFLAIDKETGGLHFRLGQMGGELQCRHELCRPSLVEGEPALGTKDQR